MFFQSHPHFPSRRETSVGIVLDRSHQNSLHLVGELRIDLTRTRILLKIEDKQRIALRICPCKQMKHRRAETVNVGAWLHVAAEKFRRSITHRADGGHALLLFMTDRS